MAEPCHTCKHYNDGHGDVECLFCDPDFEDRWEKNEDNTRTTTVTSLAPQSEDKTNTGEDTAMGE